MVRKISDFLGKVILIQLIILMLAVPVLLIYIGITIILGASISDHITLPHWVYGVILVETGLLILWLVSLAVPNEKDEDVDIGPRPPVSRPYYPNDDGHA